MYREMRRKDRVMSDEYARELLDKGEYGILSTVSDHNQPYATPLSYVVIDNFIYFHCAGTGQKIDNLEFESKVCFCVVGKTQPVYDNNFSTYFESIVVYGKAQKVVDTDEKRNMLMLLCEKYLPEHMDKAPTDISKSFDLTAVYKISIDHITGKEKRRK